MEIFTDPWFWAGVAAGFLTVPGFLAGLFWTSSAPPDFRTSWSAEPLPGIELLVDQEGMRAFLDNDYQTRYELKVLHRPPEGNPFPGESLFQEESWSSSPWRASDTVHVWRSGDMAALLFPKQDRLLIRGVSGKWNSTSLWYVSLGDPVLRGDGLPPEAWLSLLAQDLKKDGMRVWRFLADFRGFWTEELWAEAERILEKSESPGFRWEKPRALREDQ